MALSLLQLRTILNRDQALAELLETLQSLGFNTTAWQSGSIQLTLLTTFADSYARMTSVASSLSMLAFNATSIGQSLTAFSDSHYDNQRLAAASTEGVVVLTGAAVGPPHTITVGQLVATDATGRSYRNTTAGTLAASGTLELTFGADIVGSDGNIPSSTLTILQTPLAGTTIDNPPIPATGTWITSLGNDEETDASLRLRNTSKWGTLSYSDPADRYEHYVRTAVPTVPRVEIDDDDPGGPGTIHIYVAGPTATATPVDVAAAQVEADRIKNPTADVTCFAATEQPQAFVYDCYITAGLNTADTQTAVEQALTDYVNGLPISGTLFPILGTGNFVFSEALAAMTSVVGVERIDMTTPPGNVPIAAHAIMIDGGQAASFFSV